jgi:hypothetical protein
MNVQTHLEILKLVDPLEYIKLIFELIDKYIPSPAKEILLGAFGATLVLGLVYGLFFRGFASSKKSGAPTEEGETKSSTPLRDQLREANADIRDLEARLKISLFERYYLYFNGIANASLMLGFAVLVDRFRSTSARDSLPIKVQIGSFISILLVGLVTSIVLNVLVDLLATAPPRRTDVINRAFLIALAINVLVFLAYHLNYLNI